MLIRLYEKSDWPQLLAILQATFERGDTYAYAPGSTEAEIQSAWITSPETTFVACSDSGQLLGSYVLKPNQPGLGSHVCNCGYVVSELAQGQGVATALCAHSQVEAVRRGYKAMQFNLVVSTNVRAVTLWSRLGFRTVGVLPQAFRHRELGLVDALVMFKALV